MEERMNSEIKIQFPNKGKIFISIYLIKINAIVKITTVLNRYTIKM